MDFKQLSNFFGGTIFADEYRADFLQVNERLNSLSSTVSESSPLQARAELQLLRAVDAAMRGELAIAERSFDYLEVLAKDMSDRSWRQRCANYKFYLLSLRRVSPVLRFRRDCDNDSGIRKERELDIVEKRQRLRVERRVASSQDTSPLEKLESDIIISNSSFVDDLWRFAQRSHPSYPRNPVIDSVLDNEMLAVFNSSEPYPQQIIKSAERLDLDMIAGYTRRLVVEYWIAGDSPKAQSMLSELGGYYLTRNDIVGAANCKLIHGDTRLSHPFTNPIALNLISLDQGLGWDNMTWDATEAMFPLRKCVIADAHYQTAFDLFGLGASKRGQAAVHLRRACVDHMVAVAEEQGKQSTESTSLYNSAARHLNEAARLFQRDSVNLQIVHVHQLLLNISTGSHDSVLHSAFQIGQWGALAENHAVSQFAGLLILRFGRMLFMASGDTALEHAKALLCCACARDLFKALRDPLLELQAIVAQAMLHQRLGRNKLAKALIGEGQSMLLGAFQCYDQLIRTLPKGKTHETLQLLQDNRLEDFNQATRAILGPGAPAVSMPISPMAIAIVELHRLARQSREAVNSDYYETMKKRRTALIVNADVNASEDCLRGFLARWSGSTIGVSFGSTLPVMEVAIFHYLGEYEKARQVLHKAIPALYGGEDTSNAILSSEEQLAEQSLGLCFLAKDWQMGQIVIERIRIKFPDYPNDITPHDYIWQLLVWIGRIEEYRGHLGEAFDRYQEAVHVMEKLRRSVPDPDVQRDMFSSIHSGELYSGLARISRRFAQDQDLARSRIGQAPSWKDRIFLYLERGRSRAIVDLLMEEKGVSKDEQDNLQQWAIHTYRMRELQDAVGMPEEQRSSIIKALAEDLGIEKVNVAAIREELEKQSLRIESLPGGICYDPSADVLYRSVPKNAICIHINISRDELLLLCITSEGIQHVKPIEVTDVEIERGILRFLRLFRQKKPPQASEYTPFLEKISRLILEPFANFIRDKGHVIFVPSRSFHKFPFSALLYDEKPLFLDREVSQVPSLTTLSYLVDKTRTYKKLAAAVIVKSDPDGQNDTEKALPMAGVEAVHVARIHDCVPRRAGSLSNEDFRSIYESSNIIHIVTHGIQSHESAWQSSITLRGNFRVHDLAKLRSNAAMVIFCACVSGLGEDTIGNDMLGFSHAVIASGALSFLGGLWDVDEIASMLLMVFFHREIVERQPNTTLAGCWRRAQNQLYGLNTAKAKAVLEQLRDGWDQMEKDGRIPGEISRQPRNSIQYLIEDIDWMNIPFNHPQYWAPFVLVGHGGLVLHKEP